MWWLLLSSLAFGGRWDDASADIVVERVVPGSPEQVQAPLTDFAVLEQLFPSDCVKDWEHGVPSSGVGALTRVTYKMGSMRRRLTATISKVEPGRLVELDHAGNKGFITQLRFEPEGDGTKVTLGTWIQAPPWPFKGVYFKNVQPAWEGCWTRTLDRLADKAKSLPPTPVQAPAAPEPEVAPEPEPTPAEVEATTPPTEETP